MTPEQLASQVKQPTAAEIRSAILAGLGINAPGFGYDRQFDQGVNDLYAGQATGLSQLDLGQQRATQDYSKQETRLGESRDKAMGGLQGYFADRGMTYSGANIDKQSEVGKGYADSLSDLVTNRTRTFEDIDRQRNSIYDYVRDQLAGLKGGYTDRVTAEQAQRDRKAAEAQQMEKDLWHRQSAAGQQAKNAARIGKVYPALPTKQYVKRGPEIRETTDDRYPVYS